jgi:hypothetical protein
MEDVKNGFELMIRQLQQQVDNLKAKQNSTYSSYPVSEWISRLEQVISDVRESISRL